MLFTKNIILGCLILGVALMLSACSAKNEKIVAYKFSTDITGLKLQKNNSPTLVYVRPGAAALSTYKHFIVDPIQVDYNDASVKKLSASEILKLQQYFHKSMVSKLKENGHIVINQVEPNTMRISFILSGIKAPNATANIVSLLIPVALSVGGVTVEATFSDATSKEVSAVVVNKSQGSRVLNATPWSTWADIEASFDQWADGICKNIDK